jgi:hypothetical protein
MTRRRGTRAPRSVQPVTIVLYGGTLFTRRTLKKRLAAIGVKTLRSAGFNHGGTESPNVVVDVLVVIDTKGDDLRQQIGSGDPFTALRIREAFADLAELFRCTTATLVPRRIPTAVDAIATAAAMTRSVGRRPQALAAHIEREQLVVPQKAKGAGRDTGPVLPTQQAESRISSIVPRRRGGRAQQAPRAKKCETLDSPRLAPYLRKAGPGETE